MGIVPLSRSQKKLIYFEDFREELERLNNELMAYKSMYDIVLKEVKELTKANRQFIDEISKLKKDKHIEDID